MHISITSHSRLTKPPHHAFPLVPHPLLRTSRFYIVTTNSNSRGRGFRRDMAERRPLQVQIDLSARGDDEYDVLVRSALPPGGAIWNGRMHYPTTDLEDAELQWAASVCNFDARTVKKLLRDAIVDRPEAKAEPPRRTSGAEPPAEPARKARAFRSEKENGT